MMQKPGSDEDEAGIAMYPSRADLVVVGRAPQSDPTWCGRLLSEGRRAPARRRNGVGDRDAAVRLRIWP